MDHGPSTEWGVDRSSGYKTRLGLWMFLVYCLVYAGFIVVCSVWPKVMAKPVGGLNMAVTYGFGLIVLALIMAFVYNSLAGKAEERYSGSITETEEEEEE